MPVECKCAAKIPVMPTEFSVDIAEEELSVDTIKEEVG
jgi:hypothetical protein